MTSSPPTPKLHVPASLGERWGEGETADAVAAALKAAGGASVSGEVLCRGQGLTRTAIWKAVRQLRREGYTIGASRRVGYRLAAEPDAILPRTIREGLGTRALGSSAVCFRKTCSTNDAGLRLAELRAPEGLVVTAEEQTGGRGRLGRSWHSPAGAGLWFSVILRPNLPVSGAQALTFLGAVSTAYAIRAMYGIPVALKWPNDIMLEGRKLGGVLTELAAESDLIRHAVVGVGLNVNVTRPGFPAAIRDTAASLRTIMRRRIPRVPLLRRILLEMDRRYAELVSSGSGAALVAEWRELTPMIGSIIRVSHFGHVREGTVAGVDPDGALLLRSPSGVVDRLLAGDVTVLRR
jgi:BirA family biotin operon repressor/biotin-[acetyl-CoA-carboxylase] ligase